MIKLKMHGALIFLTLASFYIVARSASNEPYFTFRWADAIEQVVCGGALLLAWLAFAAYIGRAAALRHLSRA